MAVDCDTLHYAAWLQRLRADDANPLAAVWSADGDEFPQFDRRAVGTGRALALLPEGWCTALTPAYFSRVLEYLRDCGLLAHAAPLARTLSRDLLPRPNSSGGGEVHSAAATATLTRNASTSSRWRHAVASLRAGEK